jgi:hypothetical protein
LRVWIWRIVYFSPFCALWPGFSTADIGATATVAAPVRSTSKPDWYSLISAMSAWSSSTAYTSFVGFRTIGSKFAMLSILDSIAATLLCTFLISFISSILDMCVGFFLRCCVYSSTRYSYCAIASFTFASTFFNTVSSRTPNFAYRLESVRTTALSFPMPVCPFCGQILFSAAVRFTTCASAASRRVVSFSSIVLSCAGVSGVV